MKREAVVISSFPGTGKTTLAGKRSDLAVVDCVPGEFAWRSLEDRRRRIFHPDWPGNYIDNAIQLRASKDVVLVSTHREVREELIERGVELTLVYPNVLLKEEYIARYEGRGSYNFFVELMRQRFDEWIAELEAQQGCRQVVLSSGQYLEDVIPAILKA